MEDYLKNASMMAQTSQLPGQQLMEEKLAASSASGIRSMEQGASSSAGLMAGIAGLKGAQLGQLTDIQIAGAEYQDVNKQRLQEALLKYGTEQDKQFDINKMQPYKEKVQAAEAMTGAGMQNIMSGIEGIGGAASMAASGGEKTTGSTANQQAYKSAKRKGFKGDYNAWLTYSSATYR